MGDVGAGESLPAVAFQEPRCDAPYAVSGIRRLTSAGTPLHAIQVKFVNLAESYRRFEEGPFWNCIPAYRNLDNESFLDPAWQARNSVRTIDQIAGELIDDLRQGLRTAPMSIRVTPYILARID